MSMSKIIEMSITRCKGPARTLLITLRTVSASSCCGHSVVQRKIFARPASTTTPNTAQAIHKMFIAEERGSLYTPEYRVYFKDENGPISPMHDIPLWADKSARLVNMVVEVPRWTNAKMEISLSEALNPIKQDIKKGALRFVANVFPHHGYIWNYGALPQTWENPQHIDAGTGARGDNDPIDVIEIGNRVAARGDVIAVKILGTIALIDEGETDWKLIAIDVRDPMAAEMNDISDVERMCPGLLRATVEWFRLYKVPDGKPPNQFAFEGEAKNADFAYKVIDEVHEFWKSLVNGEVDANDICKKNVSIMTSPNRVERSDAASIVASAAVRGLPRAPPANVDKNYFLASNIKSANL